MALTEEQKRCVETLDRSLVVAAGAGSGKTFTLTERIVHAFETGFVHDLDQVCAITFTKKAAGELKSRIKSELKVRGFVDQALKVDDAWISTIHGMCARILRANAVELGIDPAFTVAEGADLDAYLARAVDAVLVEAGASDSSDRVNRLFDAWPARSNSPFGTSVESMLSSLVGAASVNPRGAEAFVMPGKTMPAAAAVGEIIGIFAQLAEIAEGLKPSDARDSWLAETRGQLEVVQVALERGVDDYEEALGLVGSLKLRRNFGGKKFTPFVDEAKLRVNACLMELHLGAAAPYLDTLAMLAGRALDKFARLKHEGGVLDNNDLLVFAARAIEEHPGIAARYTDKFKLVMVDEFQDTDQMQVDMIKRLAGAGAMRLCTVGDAQQSIYRFRGADVSVYRRHLASVQERDENAVIKLSKNFRSHGDVLAFVERVFEQPDMFGGEFMPLSADRSADKEDARFASSDSRITLLHTSHPHTGLGIDETRKVVARRIASEFAALRDRGHSAGEMVVLLGGMKNAGVYAEALRQEGFACVISGGSVFAETREAKIVVAMLHVLANPTETEPLFNVLTSPMFGLGAADLQAVGGLSCFWNAEASEARFSRRAECALRVMRDVRDKRGSVEPSLLIRQAALESGWLSRLEAQGPEGLAAAGNLYKAIRMVAAIEKSGAYGPVSVMRRFEETLASSKESPGALSVSGGDSVRLMTIHSSKGLEFPIVAVAELRDDKEDSSQLVSADIDGKIYLSLDLPTSLLDRLGGKVSSADKRALSEMLLGELAGEEELANVVKRDSGALYRRLAVCAYHATGEAEEGKRLLYVALTRAKEALVVATVSESKKDDLIGTLKNAFSGVHVALGGERGLELGRTMADFGGANPAVVECVALTADGAVPDMAATCGIASDIAGTASESDSPRDETFMVPIAREATPSLQCEPYRPLHQGVFSYSSISGLSDAEPAWDARYFASEATVGDSAMHEADSTFVQDEDRATDLGTAFHRLAQYAVVARGGEGPLAVPPPERVEAIATSCGLGEGQRIRLQRALDSWFASGIAREAEELNGLAAEVPFFIEIGDLFLEGEIDLLGYDESRRHASIVDYKTGGSEGETPEDIARKHELQAQCYAYAVLKQGVQAVDAAFVRVEQGCEQVRYSFESADLPEIERRIRAAYDRLTLPLEGAPSS